MLKRSLLILVLMSAGILGLPAVPASALTAAAQPVMQKDGNAPLLIAARENRNGNRAGNRSGGRCAMPNCQNRRAGDRSRNRDGVDRNRVNRNNVRANRVDRGRANRDDRAGRGRIIRNDNFRRDNFRHNRNNWVYNRHRHGPRCLSRFGNCRHFYRGYYYYSPFWTLPYAGVAVIAGSSYGYRYNDNYDDGGYSSRHVAWCRDRYRSYDVSSNTWVSYSGEIRQCKSPYN